MQTRRDHLQAYQFAVGRLSTALLTGDAARADRPGHRAAKGTVLGVGAAVLMCAGFGVYGLISPKASTSWRSPDSIVMNAATGSRYLYLNGTLRPVRNYASALLILGKDATLRQAPAAALGRLPEGSPVGIDGAPDDVPAATALTGAVWTRCLAPTGLGASGAGTVVPVAPASPTAAAGKATGSGSAAGGTSGAGAASGTSAAGGAERVDFAPATRDETVVPADRQALLTGPDGRRWLLWDGVLHQVPDTAALIALGLDGDRPHPAPQDWLNALPTGVPLSAAAVPDAGHHAPAVGGRPSVVGQLFHTTVGGTAHDYVMTTGGIAPIGPTEAALLAARPGAAAARQVTPAEVAAVRVAGDSPGADLPPVLDAPEAAPGTDTLCLRQQAHGSAIGTAVVQAPAVSDPRPVQLPSGAGVLAVDQNQLAHGQSNPQTYLISDQGIAYPLDQGQAQAALGLGNATATALPTALLAVLPSGPVLATATARLTVQGG